MLCCGCGGYYTGDEAFKYYSVGNQTVFGSGITANVAVRGGDTQKAIKLINDRLTEIDLQFDLNKENAVSKFNGALAFERIKVDKTVYDLISLSIELYGKTDGAFNIAVLPLGKLWSVDTEGIGKYAGLSPDKCPPLPSYEQVSEVKAHCDISNLHLEQSGDEYYIYKSDSQMQIDLGAIVKGYAADECIRIAESCGVQSALINISGNVSVLGEWYKPDRKKYCRWEIGVTAPRPKGGSMDAFALSVPRDKTLVTSGDYVRYYRTEYNGNTLSVPHIVDGSSGLPMGITYDDGYAQSEDNIISATIICSESAVADAVATAVCLMPQDKAVEFIKANGMQAALFTADGKLILIGITEGDESGEEYFIYKDEYSLYRQYKVEYALE